MKKIISKENVTTIVVVIVIAVVVIGFYLNFIRPVYENRLFAYTVITMNDGSVRTNFQDRGKITVSPSEVRDVQYVNQDQSVKAIIDGTTKDGVKAKFEFTLPFSFRTEESLQRPEIDDHIKQLQTALVGNMGQYVDKIFWSTYKHDGQSLYAIDRESPDLREAINRLGAHWDGTIKVRALSSELAQK